MPAAWLRHHPWACFGLMTLAFLAFGGLTLDLVRVLQGNLAFLAAHGRQAVQDQGLWQLLGLGLQALAAVACWLLFKTCETVLLQRLAPPSR